MLPGLSNSHTHIFLSTEDPTNGGYYENILKAGIALRAARATYAARRALEQGFTTLRDVETEGAGYGDIEIKQAIEEGTIPGPRIFGATRAISTTGGYNLEGYAPELDMPKGAQLVDGPVEARKAARQQLEHGADWIKVYMTHRSWVDKQGNLVSQPTLTVEELKAIVDEAHGWQKKVACHAYNGIGLQRALDGGCDSIEHGLEITDAQIAQMKRLGTWYCPTLSPYYDDWAQPDTLERKRDRARAAVHEISFKKALQAHLKIVFGTDMGGIPWTEPIAQEFKRMVSMGMAPMDAIQSATSRSAEMLDMKGEIGVIAAGAYAEVVAVGGERREKEEFTSDFDAHAFPESNAVLDFSSGGFRFWVIPRGVFVLHAADADMVVMSSSLPRTDGSVLARPEEFRLNGIGREVLVALNNDRGVAFSDDFAAPRCFRHFVGLFSGYRRTGDFVQSIGCRQGHKVATI